MCGLYGYHKAECSANSGSMGSYSVKLTTTKQEDKMATTDFCNNVIEVVLITVDDDGNQQLAFGPKAFMASNVQAAVAKATGKFIEGGGDADEVVNALTRFFG